ncbi:MAG: dienelactone hydrolase family protein [Acidimicrobiales bacterium]
MGSRELRGYLAAPSGDGPWPGVVVIHDIFGLTPDLRAQCDWFAREGFLALGPDLYSRGNAVACLRSIVVDFRAQRGPTFDAIDAARARLVSDERCSGHVGVNGYCIGGAFSLLLAADDRYGVSGVNYADVPSDVVSVLAGACPVVASYGGKDRRLLKHAARLENALEVNNVPHDFKVYPRAGHGFLNEHVGKPALFIAVAGRLIGVHADEASASDARRRIIDFFTQYLKDR